MTLASLVEDLLGEDLPVGVAAYDGSSAGPPDPPATLRIRTPDALRRILAAPGELGFARAYVAGDIELDGDIYALLGLHDRVVNTRMGPRFLRRALDELGGIRRMRRLPPPEEEVRLHGRRHSRQRDQAAVSHHYDVSNRFYEMVLGPSLTYSCAIFHAPDDPLEQAQANKYELVCRKLQLGPDTRLLDVGCGWGGMVMHAAEHHGVRAVGVTLSRQQAELATKRVHDAGLSDRVEIRLQDYREVDDGPFDAISSIGMFEHVGESKLGDYFGHLQSLLKAGGRLLNHGISRPRLTRAALPNRSFSNRYVFPDGELHEVGRIVTRIHQAGLEVRHLESFREHYNLTLRRWVANLERCWDDAVAEVGAARARVWRLYMAGSAMDFLMARLQLNQILAVRSTANGTANVLLRESYE